MSSLFVYHESRPEQPFKVLTHAEDIAATLAEHGVRFDRLRPAASVTAASSAQEQENVLRAQIDSLLTEHGHGGFDVISVTAQTADPQEIRGRFLDEQVNAADEVSLFIQGQGLLALHIGQNVYALLCQKHDRVSIPAGTRRWFDMGENPHLTLIRTFSTDHGSVTSLTGDNIASLFPRLDDF